MDSLRQLLKEYEHLFQMVNDHDTNAFICMDLALDEIINDCNYYGTDCSDSQQLIMLLFCGSSDYFPALWIGNDDISNIETMPIYRLDFSCSEQDEFESDGNVKQYITQILNQILDCDTINGKNKQDAHELLEKIKSLSDIVVNKGNYRFKM
jgi:hypothetical protein